VLNQIDLRGGALSDALQDFVGFVEVGQQALRAEVLSSLLINDFILGKNLNVFPAPQKPQPLGRVLLILDPLDRRQM